MNGVSVFVKKIAAALAVSVSLFLFVSPAFAQTTTDVTTYEDIRTRGIIFAGIGNDCRDYGSCTLNDVLQVFVNVSVFILGISGSLTLLFFVYGGMLWITSGGNENQVRKGKDILAGTVIGLVIIFGAYAAITALVTVLKTGELPKDGTTLPNAAAQPKSTVTEPDTSTTATPQ